eukprot:UN18813
MNVFKVVATFGHRAILNENLVGDGKYLSCIVSYLKKPLREKCWYKNLNLFSRCFMSSHRELLLHLSSLSSF